MTLPNDPFILLSYINTQLRDYFSNLDELCSHYEISRKELEEKLNLIDYTYNHATNQFI